MQTHETKQETKEITVPNRELRCVVQRIFALDNEAELDLFYNLADAVKRFHNYSYIEIYHQLVDAIREAIAEFISEKMIYADKMTKRAIEDIIMGIMSDYDSLTSIAKIIYIFTKDDMAEVKEDEYQDILNALNAS